MLFKVSYILQHYRLGGARLQSWLNAALLGLALLLLIRALPGGWPAALLSLLLIPLSYAWHATARRNQYVQFHAQRAAVQPAAATLSSAHTVACHATGLFEVEDKQQRLSETPALFRTFATREHAVLVSSQPRARLKGLLRPPEQMRGMWYAFFKPAGVQQIEPGALQFGRQQRPALRLRIEPNTPIPYTPSDAWGIVRKQPLPAAPRPHTLYLSFATPEERNRVWADLLADAP